VDIGLGVAVAQALIRRWEGVVLKPYLCPAAVPTIGFGATYYEDGRRVSLRDPAITMARAEELLQWMVYTKYLPAVLTLCPGINSPERLAAIIDFTFNLGSGNLRASTLRRRINADQWSDVPRQLLRWDKAGGRVLHGLTLRRKAEAALI